MLKKSIESSRLSRDLPRLMRRREVLGGAVGLSASVIASAASANCVALPWETAGPYPGDGSNSREGAVVNILTQEGVIRKDLRASFGDYTGEVDGERLDLELTLQNTDGCTPLAGHAIYVWACDTTGLYSLYDTPDANYLRGVGVSDDNGLVQFTTVFPGCYDGRWPHIHFEVFESAEAAVSGEASVLTAQMALPEAECAALYGADSRYSNGTRNLGRISLPTDNVFSDNTVAELDQQMLSLTGGLGDGYVGNLTIPIDFEADRSVSMPPPPGEGGLPPGPPPSDG